MCNALRHLFEQFPRLPRGNYSRGGSLDFDMTNSTFINSVEEEEVPFRMEKGLMDVEMDLVLDIADKTTLVVFVLTSMCNVAVLVTLGKLSNVKNFCPVRLLQILSVYQLLWGTFHGIEDPRLRPIVDMVPEFASRDVACKVYIDLDIILAKMRLLKLCNLTKMKQK